MKHQVQTAYFGLQSVADEHILTFPAGLPGFESCRRFAAFWPAELRPLVFLQSMERPETCFVSLPARAVMTGFTLEAHPDDLALVGFASGETPQPGENVLCLALVSLHEDGATANLRAPVVANLHTRLAVQAINPAGRYSHREPLPAEAVAA